ncbi:DM13 domain-containing protein [Nonomuraea sp. NPDC047897]|uniref:DM13 domain-containing protein n=1 Tax=Nonomuraea sp. NPDC047897 TaxID=3364346 RepID=UPI00371C6384
MKLLIVLTAALGVPALALAMYLFQPWRLVTTQTVNEAPPTVASAPAARPQEPASATPQPIEELASGTFVSHEHATTGTARLLRLPDGSRVLRVENLKTSDGPDLRVWLSDQPVTKSWVNFDDGRHLELGHLKGNRGNANYAVPADADIGTLTSVTIWCRRFSVSFGAAALTTP